MGVFNRMMNFIGFGEEEVEERESADANESEQQVDAKRARGTVVSIHANKTSKVVLAQPESYKDVVELIEHLRARRIVFLNLQGMDAEISVRIVDKLQGAILAFNGKLETVGIGIYMCAPDNFEINGAIDLKKQFGTVTFEQPGAGEQH